VNSMARNRNCCTAFPYHCLDDGVQQREDWSYHCHPRQLGGRSIHGRVINIELFSHFSLFLLSSTTTRFHAFISSLLLLHLQGLLLEAETSRSHGACRLHGSYLYTSFNLADLLDRIASHQTHNTAVLHLQYPLPIDHNTNPPYSIQNILNLLQHDNIRHSYTLKFSSPSRHIAILNGYIYMRNGSCCLRSG